MIPTTSTHDFLKRLTYFEEQKLPYKNLENNNNIKQQQISEYLDQNEDIHKKIGKFSIRWAFKK